jgi:dTDP-4-dehydrorhamnose 3,5-epimerase
MDFKTTRFDGLIEITPRVFFDERGYFYETYQKALFIKHGIPQDFLQDNQSFSLKGVLRGLHFQKPPYAQGKLVRVISGSVLDVVVDIRPKSPTFGQHEKFLLSAENRKMVYVPEGFAHGFYTLEDAVFSYKCTNIYDKASEGGIIWNDADLNIDWECKSPIVSEKDLELSSFKAII